MTRSRAAALTSLVTAAAMTLAVVVASVSTRWQGAAVTGASTGVRPRLPDLGTLAALPVPASPSPPRRPTDADVAAAREFVSVARARSPSR